MKQRNSGIKNNPVIKIIAAFSVIYFVWGSTYLAIRLAIDTIPPFVMAGIRFTVAGLIFYGWCYLRNESKPILADWRRAAISGILMVVCGNGMVTWSEQLISSGFASLIVATVPIWMVILDWVQSGSNRPNRTTIAGIVLGFIGVSMLSGVDKAILIDQTRHGGSVILGVSVLTFAAISWAAGSLYSRKVKSSVSLQFSIGMQTIIGGLVLVVIGSLQGEWRRISFDEVSLLSISSLGFLILFGTLLAYSAYFWLLQVSTPAKVGTYAYFNPLVALFLGAIFVDEPVTTHMLIGTVFILVSLVMVNQPKFLRKLTGTSIQQMTPLSGAKNGKRDTCLQRPGMTSCSGRGGDVNRENLQKTGISRP
jgi:drug/metabolite transporter (DMT)-like permease